MRHLTQLSWIPDLYLRYRPYFCWVQGTGDSWSNECCEKRGYVPQLGNAQPTRQEACGFWQEIRTGQCQMDLEMVVPMFHLLLMNDLVRLLCHISSCRLYLVTFPCVWQNFFLFPVDKATDELQMVCIESMADGVILAWFSHLWKQML